MKCYVAGSRNPGDFTYVSACFAPSLREAKKLCWDYGDVHEECDGDYTELRVVRSSEHDYLFGKDGRDEPHIIRDDWVIREMSWMIDGDERCSSCDRATMDGKWPLCEECDSCEQCGHDDECEAAEKVGEPNDS